MNNNADFYNDPHAWAQEMIVDVDYPELGTVPLPGVPIKLSKTPGKIDQSAPKYGTDNAEFYQELLGITEEELKQMAEDGVI